MNLPSQNPGKARRGLILVALVGIGFCGLSFLKAVRTADSSSEQAPEVELSSLGTASMVSPETSETASGKGIVESYADRLVRFIRERLVSRDESITEPICSNEWVELLKIDTASALRLFEEVVDRSQREQLLSLLLKEWVKLDATNALGWATELSDPSERDLALRAGLTELADSDPSNAVAVTDQVFSGEQREAMLQQIVRKWASQNLDEVLAWTLARPSDDNRDKLFLELVLATAAANPEQAARIAVEHISPGVIQANAALSVVACWAQTDFPAATTWVNRFPEGQARDHAVLQLGRAAFYQAWRPALESSPPE